MVDKNNKITQKRYAVSFYSHEEILKSCNIGLSTVVLKKKFNENIKFCKFKNKRGFCFMDKNLTTEN